MSEHEIDPFIEEIAGELKRPVRFDSSFESRVMSARAQMIQRESGFDVRRWQGIESLGYRLERTIEPRTPKWFCFDFMHAVREWKKLKTVIVYRRVEPETARASRR